MTNSETFLDIYNKIDGYLKKADHHDSYVNFARKVKISKSKVVQRFKDELISFGELRNAIVHSPKIGNQVIAEPRDDTVKRISELFNQISNPKKVIPQFSLDVVGAKSEDYINDILRQMKQHSFSQFPVYDENNHVIELINTNTISRWLAKEIEEKGTMLIDEVRIKDLVGEIEYPKNYEFISRNTSVFEAYDMFIQQVLNKKRNLDVIFITDSGKKNERLLGLITISDIAPLSKG
jgi:predicted transcriptional regulator